MVYHEYVLFHDLPNGKMNTSDIFIENYYLIFFFNKYKLNGHYKNTNQMMF